MIRPFGPVPCSAETSSPASRASLRASGLLNTRSAVAAGAAATAGCDPAAIGACAADGVAADGVAAARPPASSATTASTSAMDSPTG